MRVAVVLRGSEPAIGGELAFGESLLAALRTLAPASQHDFVYYAIGARGAASPGVELVESTRRYRYRRAATYQLHDLADQLGLDRRPRTWLERSLAKREIELVWFATSYAERCDLPFVFTVLDVEHARQPWFPEVSAHGVWAQRERHFSDFVRRATRVIVPNAAGREQIVRHYRIEEERVLCLGHPTPTFALEAAQRDPLPRERVEQLGVRGSYLFYPAQFWPHKNHATLLRAIADLSRDGGTSYELVLVGSDKEGQLAHVEDLARKIGVSALVRFLGFVEPEELVALYQHAHALTYVSFFGPENLPPLEAFALGCPVVAADVPGSRDQLGDAALFAAPTSAEQIAEQVRRLEDRSLRDELSARGRERAETSTAEAYVRGVLEFFDEFQPTRECWP